MRTAVLVPFPDVAATVDRWREPTHGLPPHVTVLFPFVSPVTDAELMALGEVFGATEPLRVEFRELRRFPGVLYLAPEPAAPFAELTAELVRRYPDHPPYGDPARRIVPHLTIAQGDDALLDLAETDVAGSLPLSTTATEALLFEEGVPWRVCARFGLSGGPAP